MRNLPSGLINLIILLLVVGNTVVLGQDTDSLQVYELDPLVITGTRIERQKSDVPASISVINRREIESSGMVNILPVLDARVPGLFVNERNMVGYGVGPGSGGNISIRGVSGTPNTQVLMLIDGQPQFMGIFGHPISDAYTSSDIERVEIIRGPGSILYGSNAMGGAINLITRQPDPGLHLLGRFAYGSYRTKIFTGTAGYNKNRFSVFVSANREFTDGSRDEVDDSFQNTTGYLKVDYQVSNHINITLDGNIADASFLNPGPLGGPVPADSIRDYTRGRSALAVENMYDKVEGALKFFYNFGEHSFSDGFFSNDFNFGITFYQNLKLFRDNVITIGWDAKSFGGQPSNQNSPEGMPKGFDEKYDINESDLYLLIQQGIKNKFSLDLGYRFVNNSQYGTEHIPAAGLVYKINASSQVKLSATKGFRSPAIIDLFLFPTSNDTLQPERLWNYEISYGKSYLKNKFKFEVTGFWIDGENMIQEIIVTTPPPVKLNSGAFTNMGVEFNADYHPVKNLDLSLNYTWLSTSEKFKYAPEHKLNIQGNYRIKSFSAMVDFRYIYGLYTSVNKDNLAQDNYSLVNLRLNQRVLPWLTVFLKANNLLNATYEIDYGYPLPGFNIIGGLELRYH